MKHIKYTSIEQIDADLKILKVSNEIQYKKLLKKSEEIKASLQLAAIVPEVAREAFGIFSKGVKGAVLQFMLKRIFKR